VYHRLPFVDVFLPSSFNQAELCGHVPDCLAERVLGTRGTSLVDDLYSTTGLSGGYCGIVRPTCIGNRSCEVQLPTPAFWTEAGKLKFNFTAFEGQAPLSYSWAIGTEALQTDILEWAPFMGATTVRNVEVGVHTFFPSPTC
jgi:hypothetical protein